jgi:lysophospholipase L1-like esterase
MLGYTNTYSYSVGGTGLLTAPTYRSRSADWAAVNATAALIQMSINDDGQTTANIAAEMALLVPIVKALPTVKDVWIMGTCAKGGSNVAAIQAREPTLAAQAAALGVPYINLVSPIPLWTGSGYTGAPANNGNSDVMMYGDNAHPTQAGHDMIARAVAAGIVASRATA